MRIAIVHDWLSAFGGAERVLAEIIALYPQADLFALFDHLDARHRAALAHKRASTSFLAHAPFLRRRYRLYLPLMPAAAESLDLSQYDCVISSSFAVAKGVITGPDQVHCSYVHSPMRYAWDQRAVYLAQTGLSRGVRGLVAGRVLSALRSWDVRSAGGPDAIACPSAYVARRIAKCWRRAAAVIPPPVDLSRCLPPAPREDFYLVVSRLVPYKRVDLVAAAFTAMPDKRLVIIGDGPEARRVRAVAGPNVTLRGHASDAEVLDAMARARAFVFAGEEDFGIALVEAQASGAPVIAYHRGGAREIVRPAGGPSPTGVLFERQDAAAIVAAVRQFEAMPGIEAAQCRRNAARFAADRFRHDFADFVAGAQARFAAAADAPGDNLMLAAE